MSLFPFLLPSSLVRSSLTVWDASSSPTTLLIMLVAARVFLLIIIAYAGRVFRVMRRGDRRGGRAGPAPPLLRERRSHVVFRSNSGIGSLGTPEVAWLYAARFGATAGIVGLQLHRQLGAETGRSPDCAPIDRRLPLRVILVDEHTPTARNK